MTEEKISQEMLINRLKRIEGQVRGVQNMIREGRDCEEIVMQIAAIRSGIESLGTLLLSNYMQLCFRRGTECEPASIESLRRAILIWGRTHVGEPI